MCHSLLVYTYVLLPWKTKLPSHPVYQVSINSDKLNYFSIFFPFIHMRLTHHNKGLCKPVIWVYMAPACCHIRSRPYRSYRFIHFNCTHPHAPLFNRFCPRIVRKTIASRFDVHISLKVSYAYVRYKSCGELPKYLPTAFAPQQSEFDP